MFTLLVGLGAFAGGVAASTPVKALLAKIFHKKVKPTPAPVPAPTPAPAPAPAVSHYGDYH